VRVVVGLGGNLGDPLSWFRASAHAIAHHLRALRAAALYRSAAVSRIAQPAYLNTVLTGWTTAAPEVLLAIGKALERTAGRGPGPRDAARPLDVDLLLYGDAMRSDPELTLPHPRLRLRRFVLEPLAELEPDRALPPDGATVREVLERLDDPCRVERLGSWL
jgi:2-amino-4-hydroxy-6-hydroxymethyldihydropteridine diphosphokinase